MTTVIHEPTSGKPADLTSTFAAETVRIHRGRRSGQTVILSVDSTRLGPALGGCRVKAYDSWQDGLADVLRLSAAMTEKAAAAGLDHGGGKTVVALERSTAHWWTTGQGRRDLLADVAEVIESLGGAYITGPDVGTGPDDMAELWQHTHHVLCRPESAGGSGDSSAPTALGVISAITAVCNHLWPGRQLSTLRFSIIGLGHVGAIVGAYLAEHGVQLTVADVDPSRRTLAESWRAAWVSPDQALTADVDVVVPCAVGGILTRAAVNRLRCRAIVGAANNQLDDDTTADLIQGLDICWAPDTIVSAGGIIASVAKELDGATSQEAERRVNAIGDRLTGILDKADQAKISPLHVVRELVQQRILAGS